MNFIKIRSCSIYVFGDQSVIRTTRPAKPIHKLLYSFLQKKDQEIKNGLDEYLKDPEGFNRKMLESDTAKKT